MVVPGEFQMPVFLMYGAVELANTLCRSEYVAGLPGSRSQGVVKTVVPRSLGTERAIASSTSVWYMIMARTSCLELLRSAAFLAESLAWANTGKRIAARIAMIAMTTRSSISVNALRFIKNTSGLVYDWVSKIQSQFIAEIGARLASLQYLYAFPIWDRPKQTDV